MKQINIMLNGKLVSVDYDEAAEIKKAQEESPKLPPPPPTPEERIAELERQLKETNDKLEAAEILLGVSE